jgi:hypothetical protein
MNRTPPIEIRRALREEVGFGCPIVASGSRCGNPYLSWHHFDPPWSVREHHDVGGMIALCDHHHRAADGGAYPNEFLRELKARGAEGMAEIEGRFEWMRRDMVVVVGGNAAYQCAVALGINGRSAVRLARDVRGYLLLSVHMWGPPGSPGVEIDENDWIARGSPKDIECPVGGKMLSVRYPNGDKLAIEFREIADAAQAEAQYRSPAVVSVGATFPLTAVEITCELPAHGIKLSPRKYTDARGNSVSGSTMVDTPVAYSVWPDRGSIFMACQSLEYPQRRRWR